MSDDTAIFQGAVVFGVGFSYDPTSGVPVKGTVDRIQVQTRSADQVIEIHDTLNNISTPVQTLNENYKDADATWYDATDILHDLIVPTLAAMEGGGIYLTTGDILTEKELDSIEQATDPDPIIKSKIDLDGLDDIVSMLNISSKDIPQQADLPDLRSFGFGAL